MVRAKGASVPSRYEIAQLALLPRPVPLPEEDPLYSDPGQMLLFEHLPVDPKTEDLNPGQVATKRRTRELPRQFHFGVVRVTERDQRRWQKNVRHFRSRSRHEFEYGPQNEYLEWHHGLMVASMTTLRDASTDRETIQDVLDWALEPLVPPPKVRALSFQACCVAEGLDPDDVRELIRQKYVSDSNSIGADAS